VEAPDPQYRRGHLDGPLLPRCHRDRGSCRGVETDGARYATVFAAVGVAACGRQRPSPFWPPTSDFRATAGVSPFFVAPSRLLGRGSHRQAQSLKTRSLSSAAERHPRGAPCAGAGPAPAVAHGALAAGDRACLHQCGGPRADHNQLRSGLGASAHRAVAWWASARKDCVLRRSGTVGGQASRGCSGPRIVRGLPAVAVVGQVGGSAAVVDVFGVERFAALVDKRATTPSPAIGSAQQQEARPDRSGGDVLHVFGAVGIAALRAKAPEQHRRRDGFDGAIEAEPGEGTPASDPGGADGDEAPRGRSRRR
jgi:hypothetical protein